MLNVTRLTETPRRGRPSVLVGLVPALALLAAIPIPLPAQEDGDADAAAEAAPRPDSLSMVDRVVAVVDDTVVLQTEVQEEVFRLRQQGVEIPQDPVAVDSIMFEVLEDLIDRVMVIQRAKSEGIQAPDRMVEEMVEERFQQIRGNFGSDEELRAAVEESGRNMFQFRESLRSQARQEILLSQFRSQLASEDRLPPVSVSEEEVAAYFRERAAGVTRPATISFDRVVVPARPPEAERERARRRAEQALEEIRQDTEFAVAARRYSEDPGTREEGGDLGWIRRGDVLPELADAAWAAPPGRAVGPVRTPFGFHVVRVESVRGGERQVSHILVRPEVEEADVERARELADALADSLRADVPAQRLAETHDLPTDDLRVRDARYDRLAGAFGRAYRQNLVEPASGDLVGPFQTEGAHGVPTFDVVRVTDYRPEGNYELDEVREQIREQLRQEKQFERYLAQLREELYVEILI